MSATSQHTNQINGYNAAGDVTYDNRNQYLYDGEGRICAVNAGAGSYTEYVYDASGARVAKGTLSAWPVNCVAPTSGNGFTLTGQYLLGLGGEQVTELNGSATWVHTNLWAGPRLTATYDTHGLHFNLADPLGTRRIQAGYNGLAELGCLGLAWGNNIGNTVTTQCVPLQSGAVDATEHHFTGKERDAESGNDYFGARYYASSMGRFMSPDWASNPQAVPYASYANPQSLNLYNYMRNNPLGGTDSDGHCGDICNWVITTVSTYVATHPEVAQALGKLGDSLGLKVSASLGKTVNVGPVKLGAAVSVTSEARNDGTASSALQATVAATAGGVGGQANGTATFERNGSLVNPLDNLSGNAKGTASTPLSDVSNSNAAIGTDNRMAVGLGVNVGVASAGVQVTAGTQEAQGVASSVGNAVVTDTTNYFHDLKQSQCVPLPGCAGSGP